MIKYLFYSILFLNCGCKDSKVYMNDYIKAKLKKGNVTTFEVGGKIGYSYDTEIILKEIEGTYFPNVKMKDMEGNEIETKKLKGKKTLINKWFTKCKPCIEEMPFLNQIHSKYKNVNFISISPDSLGEINNFLVANKFNLPIVANGRKIISEELSLVFGYPLTIIMDESCKIIYASQSNIEKDSIYVNALLK